MSGAEEVHEILGAWYAAGEVEDPAEIVRRHPAQAAALRRAFAARALLRVVAAPAPAPPLPEGPLGDFRPVGEIGRGGMGVVYEAEQISLGRRVALKVLHPGASPGPRAIERFRREAQAAARLRHPHIVPVYAFGEERGVWYFAMEWVRGRTLAEVIEQRRGGPAAATPGAPGEGPEWAANPASDFHQVAAAFAHVADALEAAHAGGVIHRDVKPANIMLDDRGALRLLDFGVARVADTGPATRHGELLGTLAYMSPEHVRGAGEHIDARTDVYLLGATLYEFLTACPPFAPDDMDRLLAQILHRSPVPARRLVPTLPRALEAIVDRALRKSPAARYPDAAAMASDLRAFAQGLPIRSRLPGPLSRLGQALVRPRVAALVGAGTLAFVAWLLAGNLKEAPPVGARAGSTSLGSTAKDSGVWQARAPLSQASSGLRAVCLPGALYAISGFFTPRVALYDPPTDRWRDVAPLPEALQYFGVAVLDGRIWVVGGDRAGAGATDTLYAYDIENDRWSVEAPMPGGPRMEVGAAVLDGRLYVVGGVDPLTDHPVERVEVYDPARGEWSVRAPLPSPCAPAGGAAVIHGTLYVAGGSDGIHNLTTLLAYDGERDAWTRRAALPLPMAGQASVVEGRLVMAGGDDEDQRRVLSYDPATDSWSEWAPLAHARRAHGAAYEPLGRRLYVVSGYADGWRASVESLDIAAP